MKFFKIAKYLLIPAVFIGSWRLFDYLMTDIITKEAGALGIAGLIFSVVSVFLYAEGMD